MKYTFYCETRPCPAMGSGAVAAGSGVHSPQNVSLLVYSSKSIALSVAITMTTSFLISIDCGRPISTTARPQSIRIKCEVVEAKALLGAILLEEYTSSITQKASKPLTRRMHSHWIKFNGLIQEYWMNCDVTKLKNVGEIFPGFRLWNAICTNTLSIVQPICTQ